MVGMGCCFGSMIELMNADGKATSEMFGSDSSAKDSIAEAGYYVSKCGGSMIPCSDGAVQDSHVIKASFKMSGSAITLEFLEKPSTQKAIKKTIASQSNGKVKENAIIITKISITASRRLAERKLQTGGANIEYSVIQEGTAEDAAATSAALIAIEPSAMTSALSTNLGAAAPAGLSALPSKNVQTQTAAARPGGASSSGLSGGAVAGIVIGVMIAFALVAVAVVMVMKSGSGPSRNSAALPGAPSRTVASASGSSPGGPSMNEVVQNTLFGTPFTSGGVALTAMAIDTTAPQGPETL